VSEIFFQQLQAYEQHGATQTVAQGLLELSEVVCDMQLALEALEQHEWHADISRALQPWLDIFEAGEDKPLGACLRATATSAAT
jgi:hypothetical protein